MAGTFKTKLSPALQEKARKELNEDPASRDKLLNELREKVTAHKGLKTRTDDEFLIRFLRGRKFDVHKAFDLLIQYYTVRAQYPDYFKGLTVNSIKPTLKEHVSIILPQRDPEGRRILLVNPGKWNPAEMSIFELLKCNVINMEKIIEDEDTQVNGIVTIINAADVGMIHATNFDRTYGKIMMAVMQDAFPVRVKQLHFINEPSVFGIVFSIVKPLMKEKLSSRLQLHGSNLESLHKSLPPEFLPKELGGMLGSIKSLGERWVKELKKSASKIDKQFEYTIELPRAITAQKDEELDAAVSGTFRKLNVD